MASLIAQVGALAVVVVWLCYMASMLLVGRRKRPIPQTGPEPELVVFLVPALNEERVIGATVTRLLNACGSRGRVMVIDDGSEDGTADVLEELRRDNPEHVWVFPRRAPHAREGKGKALNAAYRHVCEVARTRGHAPDNVVIGVVDADGGLKPDVLAHVGAYFRDPNVGSVQLLVRIRNRVKALCRFQDYEFLVFSSLIQTAREKIGSVGLGGNGQFTRLAALRDLGDEPWSDCLTEDLDLGVRLAIEGWDNRFCGETFVDQQGLNSLPRLIRQRTRWMHGHFQCWRLIPRLVASRLPTVTVLDLCYYLITPAAILAASIMFTAVLIVLAVGIVLHPQQWLSGESLYYLIAMYVLSFGPGVLLTFIYYRRSREISLLAALGLGHMLAAYNYLWYLAELKAVVRVVMRKGGWKKTSRVVEDAPVIPAVRRALDEATAMLPTVEPAVETAARAASETTKFMPAIGTLPPRASALVGPTRVVHAVESRSQS